MRYNLKLVFVVVFWGVNLIKHIRQYILVIKSEKQDFGEYREPVPLSYVDFTFKLSGYRRNRRRKYLTDPITFRPIV